MNYGKLIWTLDGYTSGVKIGEVYTARKGEKGFVAGVRNRTAAVGLMREKRFASLRAAQDYAVKLTYQP